ncbi:MAG: class I SAM-dependent methyltransferase [Isosphaeraceae bacterium]|nr:class I SAM-dependent methyltransferase [Isosphaeraceae bacterium]
MTADAESRRDPVDWSPFLERYRAGEWRAPIFHDMVASDLRRLAAEREVTLLDIGCGRGFDDEPKFQTQLAPFAKRYIGVEPDAEMAANPVITEVHHTIYEDAPLAPGSIDLAYSVMVLEHVAAPEVFWNKLHGDLSDGGVFWGFTIDARNLFAHLSMLTKTLRIKDWYLDRLHGSKGEERYENYPVHYRSNRPKEIERHAAAFRSLSLVNFHRVGQLDFYLPAPLRPIGRGIDRFIQWRKLPGSIMAIRAEK